MKYFVCFKLWIFLLFSKDCFLVWTYGLLVIMSSPGQRKGACGHIMASFDKHSRCARCRDKGQGDDPCVKQLACEFCDLLSPEQVLQLSTPTCKIRKEKQKSKDLLVDPSSVTVVSHVEQEGADRPSSVNSSMDLSLPTPSFRKELQDLDDKWAVRMARLEALITMGPRPSPQQPAFSPVKVPVPHLPPEGALSQTPFLQSSVPSGQAGPASSPDGTQTTTSTDLNMVSPLENLYPDTDQEPVFLQPGPVASAVSSGPRHFQTRDVILPDQIEEGEVSEPELDDQPDSDAGDRDKVLSEDQNYRETVRGVRAFMGWTHIPDLEYSPTSRTDNSWIGHHSQPVGKVSVLLPPEDWLCKKLENMNLVLLEGYPSKSSEPGGLHMNQFLRPPKSQSRLYGIHPSDPKDPTRPGKYVNSWPNDAAKNQ